jgi:hypothetical protein
MGIINSSDRLCNIVLLGDMVCLRDVCINTLHKGDGEEEETKKKKKKMMMMIIIIMSSSSP